MVKTMNRNESRYFKTAAKMDEAFLRLIEEKDLEFITVKEICNKAGVNRSTFYLHYETIDDLLSESLEYMNGHFLDFMGQKDSAFIEGISQCQKEELYLVTPKYLEKYLEYVKSNRHLFENAVKRPQVLRLDGFLYSRNHGNHNGMAEKQLRGFSRTNHVNHSAMRNAREESMKSGIYKRRSA